MTCPKCHKQFSKSNAWECPVTNTYICPECRVGLSDGVTDEIRVENKSVVDAFADDGKPTEERLF